MKVVAAADAVVAMVHSPGSEYCPSCPYYSCSAAIATDTASAAAAPPPPTTAAAAAAAAANTSYSNEEVWKYRQKRW